MTNNVSPKPPIWRDERFWKIAFQVLAVVAVVTVFAILGSNLSRNLQRSGIQLGFDFLNNKASFAISETTLVEYDPGRDPYKQVLIAGLLNTIRVAVSGIILTTVVGILAGVAQFSDNWLLRKLSEVYVEIVRNTPLLLQLLFWYSVFLQLPRVEEKITWPGPIFLSKRGINIPWPASPQFGLWLAILAVGAIAAFFLWKWRTKVMVEQGASGQTQLFALWAMAIGAILIVVFAFGWQAPQATETGISGGLRLSIEFSALLIGLVFYTGAFIAEIVRAGIQSVPKGQWEAARSLGLNSGSLMQLVIFPQALRVMIPPLNSQYQNLIKNSSLAIAVAYPDIYNVANTTFNQTGRVVEIICVIMLIYLGFNLLVSLLMNLLNRSVQIQER